MNLEEIKKALEEFKANLPDHSDAIKELSDRVDELNDEATKEQLSELATTIKVQGELLAKMQGSSNANKDPHTIEDDIAANKAGINSAIKKEVKEHEFVVKANVTRASVTNSTDALRLTDIGQLAHRKLSARSIFPIVPVGAGSNGVIRYSDWDQATTVRAAATVAEGDLFNESTAVWEEFTLDLKKIGDSIPVTEEMVQDQPRFAAELNQFLNTNIALKEDEQLVTGNGTGNQLNGIYVTAPTYTAAASGISDASIYDLIVKMKEDITEPYGGKYEPNFAMMNIADINKMKLKKDANENYILPPFVDRAGNVVDGITIVECNVLTADTMLIGDSRFAKLYEVEGYNISVGYVNDQFTRDLMTLKAKLRENLLIRNVDKTGFLKCTGITAALVTLATP
jgi:HK97 family phage major capsid protein